MRLLKKTDRDTINERALQLVKGFTDVNYLNLVCLGLSFMITKCPFTVYQVLSYAFIHLDVI